MHDEIDAFLFENTIESRSIAEVGLVQAHSSWYRGAVPVGKIV